MAPAAGTVEFADDFKRIFFETNRENSVFIGVELQIFAGRVPSRFFDRLHDDVGSESVKLIGGATHEDKMTERLKINNYDIEILRRPRQRTLRLRVTAKGCLRVTCARTVPKREIFQFVSSNLGFIEQQLEEARKIREQYPTPQFTEGEALLFFGRERKIHFRAGGEKLKLSMEAGEFIFKGSLAASTREDRHAAVRKFYRKTGLQYLTQRLEFFSRTMGLQPSGVSFRCQSSRWGSCSGEGHISLNWRLMAAPPDVIDYVVVHELSHLQHHDHSPRFWKLVAAFSPRYRELKNWLNQNQWALEFLAPSSSSRS